MVVERRLVVERDVDAPPCRRVRVGPDPVPPVRHNHVTVNAQGAREMGRLAVVEDAQENSPTGVDVRLRDLHCMRPRWQHHGAGAALSLSLSLRKRNELFTMADRRTLFLIGE